MQSHYETLLLEYLTPQILQVSLNRLERHNAINSQMMKDLSNFWAHVAQDNKEVRCIILTGNGDKAFCAGADLKERMGLDLKTWREHRAFLEQAMLAMSNCAIPIIAAVNGVAFGGGLELVLAADFAYASEAASFAQSEVKLGLMPGAMGTQNLPRACGLRRAKELALTGDAFSAQEAYEWGIVNQVCPAKQLAGQVFSVAEKIAHNAPLAVQATKQAINTSHYSDITSGFAAELEAYNTLLNTADREEGIRAFNEKRVPQFKGK